MGMAVGGSKGSMSEPNIVPLIDVLLVLIIIFMVITPTIPQGLDALVPQPTPPNQKQDDALLGKTIVGQGTSNGKVMINQDDITGDDAVEFAQVARAIDIMRGAGIDNVGLITAKIEAGQ